MFKILKKDKHTRARLGVLSTAHGKIQTPSYVIVATHAEIKCLKPSDIKKTKTQVVIANTYHLWEEALNSKLETLNKLKAQNPKSPAEDLGSPLRDLKFKTFLLKKIKTKLPTMTDSGGFQVFSLGFGGKNKIGKIGKILNHPPVDNRLRKSVIHRKNIRITGKGAYFNWDGKTKFLGPELSMKLQEKIGADIIFAFDECTSPLDDFDYNKKALERTHKWAKICLKSKKSKQMLFGIVQGGKYKTLRTKSAKFIGSLYFDGFGIGGSFGKDEMVKTLKWVVPHLPEEKPRHLLGIGKIKDVFSAVEQGMDLFDCVIPTREARHGRIYTKHGYFDIRKKQDNRKLIEKRCKCSTCKSKITRAKLQELFKGAEKEKLRAQRYATIHNIWFFNNLIEDIRKSIQKDEFSKFKKKFLDNFS